MGTLWIADTNDKSGWPFLAVDLHRVDGLSTSDQDTAFDAAMRLACPWDCVYVGPGTFLTRGICGSAYGQTDSPGWRMQPGMQLIGAGKATTLKLSACNDGCGGVVIGSNVDGAARNMHVSDLTVDCNAPEIVAKDPSRPWYIQGVQLWGSGCCRIERVHVKNACAMGENGAAPCTECFVLCINSPGNSIRNLISRCAVTDFYNPTGNGACSAISMNCWSGKGAIGGTIEDCSVILNGERGWGFGGEFAYNASNANCLTLQRCTSIGAQRGFNNDTWPNRNMIMADNFFDMPAGVCAGVLLLKSNRGSLFVRNTVVLRGANSSGFQIEKADTDADLTLTENRIVAVGAWTGRAYGFNCYSNLQRQKIPTGVKMENNQVTFSPAAQIDCLLTPDVGPMSGNTVNGVEWLWPVNQNERRATA